MCTRISICIRKSGKHGLLAMEKSKIRHNWTVTVRFAYGFSLWIAQLCVPVTVFIQRMNFRHRCKRNHSWFMRHRINVSYTKQLVHTICIDVDRPIDQTVSVWLEIIRIFLIVYFSKLKFTIDAPNSYFGIFHRIDEYAW